MTKKRRKVRNTESHMTDEWLELHETDESPLFWVDISSDSRLATVQSRLVELESQASNLLERPLQFLRQLRPDRSSK